MNNPRTMLIHFDRAKREVQIAATLAAARKFRDQAAAVAAYAKLAKDRALLDRAAELRLRAERRMGELLAAMEASGEKAKKGTNRYSRGEHLATAESIGISAKEAARAKRLADAPADDFEGAVADAKAAGQLTEKIVVKRATKRKVDRAESNGAWPFRGTWTAAEITEARAWFASIPRGRELQRAMAEGGTTSKHVLLAARHCGKASPAYVKEAVDRMLSKNGMATANMLYGEEAPGDPFAQWIGVRRVELEEFPRDSRAAVLRVAFVKATQLSDAKQAKETARWKALYAAT